MTQPPERSAAPPDRSLPRWTAGQLLATWLAVPMIVINLLWGTLATLAMPFSAFTDNPFLAEAAEHRPRMIFFLATAVGLPFVSACCGIVLLATGWALGRPRRTIAAAVILALPYVVAAVLSAVPSF